MNYVDVIVHIDNCYDIDDVVDSMSDRFYKINEMKLKDKFQFILDENKNPIKYEKILREYLLKDLEVQLIDARDGKSGVELAALEKPDLILMDIQLPILDGYEATRQIRQMEKGNPVPIVAITSHAMTGDRDQCFACGCTHYIENW